MTAAVPGSATRAAEGYPSRARPAPHTLQPPRPVPRTISHWAPADVALAAGCAASALIVAWLVFAVFTDGAGWLAALGCWYLVFISLLYLTFREQAGQTVAADQVATVVIGTGAVLLAVPLAWVMGYIALHGYHALRPSFFLHDQRGVTPVKPATAGGGLHAIIGTVEQVGLALAASFPLSLLTAVFLNETRSRWRRPVRTLIDAMSGLPSIMAGLFIYATLVIPFGNHIKLFGFDGFNAALALAIVMVPTLTRTTDVVLRLVPDGLRESALALGSSRARMVWSVVLPTARTGVTTSVVLGVARAVGETAPLLFTSFGYDLLNTNPFSDPQESLPLFAYRNVQKQSQAAIDRGFTGALVLLLVVLGLFLLARYIGRQRGKSGRRGSGRVKHWMAKRPALSSRSRTDVQ